MVVWGLKRVSKMCSGALSWSEIENAFFVSKVVDPYDQPIREAADYSEFYSSDPSFWRKPQWQVSGA